MSKQLKPDDIAAKTGIAKDKVEACIKHGFLQPRSYTATGIEVTKPNTGKTVVNPGRIIGDPIDKKTGKQLKPEKGSRIEEVQKARLEGRPFEIKREQLTAEEVFDAYMAHPAGKRLLKPAFQREVEMVTKGFPPDWKGGPQFSPNHPNYDKIEWDKTGTSAKVGQ